jgi:hypothetical protein
MISVVFPTVLSRVLRTFVLLFILYDMMHRVAIDDILLYISSHVGVIGICLSWGCYLYLLLCFLDNCYVYRVSRVICCMGMVSMAGGRAVSTI